MENIPLVVSKAIKPVLVLGLFLILCFSVQAYYPTQNIPLSIQLDYNNGTGAIKGCQLNFTVWYGNGTLINKKYHGTEIWSGLYVNQTFRPNISGDYMAMANCTKGVNHYTAGLGFTIGGEDDMIISALIIAPVLFAIVLLIWTHSLGEAHPILKTFLSLSSFVLFWLSLQLGLSALIKFYSFPEMQNTLGFAVKISGYVFFIIVAYWLIYLIYVMVNQVNEKKTEKLEY
jgi:hypothetical protein